jgi:glycosyltransferase involved in cell wall biosynthesis
MKISHLSTFWPNRFGHTHYTNNLLNGMRAHRPERHIVLAERGSAPAETEAYTCVPCFSRNEDYVDGIVAEARKAAPDVMLIQYSNDLFGEDNRFPRLLQGLRKVGVRAIVNTHSVYPERRRTAYRPGRTAAAFDRAMAAHATRLQVHTQRMRADLVARGIPEEQIVVIPHGSKAIERRDPAECRAMLGLPADAKVVVFFGFIWLGKGIDFLLTVFKQVVRQVPEAFLLIAGHTRHNIWASYVTYLKMRAALLGISGRSSFWGQYVSEEMVPTMFSVADLVAMPYRQDYSSVSGIVHQAAGIGKLMLCSRTAKFDEVEAVAPELTAPYGDRAQWTASMVRLLRDPVLGQALRQRINRFGQETSWNNVGRMHLELCAGLIEERQAC